MNKPNFFRNLLGKFIGVGGTYSVRSTLDLSELVSGTANYFNLAGVSLYVDKGIQKRSQKVGQTQFRLLKNGEEVLESPTLDLIDKPNNEMTGKQFWALVNEYKDISGFAVIKKIYKNPDAIFRDLENIVGLEVMNSKNVTINYENGNGKKIVSFTETMRDGNRDTVAFDDCIYWIKPDPLDPTKGISLLRSGLYAMDTDNQLSIYQNAIIKNGGIADTVFTLKSDLTDSQKENLKKQYLQDRRDPKMADMPYFLGADIAVQRLGMTPSELAYLETKKLYARDMYVITGVPASVLGITSDETFANADQAYKVFINETVKPIVEDLVNILNWKLVPEGYELSFVDPSPDDVDLKIKKVNALYTVDASTINERREIMGLDRIEDPKADEVMVSFAKQPLGYEEPPMTQQLSIKSKNIDTKKSKNIHYLLKDKGFRDIYRKVALKRMDKREAQFYTMITEYFADQEKRIIEAVKDEKKAFKKALVDDVLNEGLEIKIATTMSLPLLRRFLVESGKDQMDILDNPTTFDMTKQIEKWLSTRANIFAKEITSTTYNKLKAEFTESFDNNETRQQLIKRVESVYNGFDKNRAKTIARTETHGAVQKGSFEGSKQAGAEIKIWVSVMDDRTRDSHAYLDGEEVPLDKAFSNGGMYPSDPKLDPSESINCRCMMA